MYKKCVPRPGWHCTLGSAQCRGAGVHAGVQGCRGAGVQGCRGAGVQGCRGAGSSGGAGVQGAGCRVQGAGRRVQGAGCRVQGAGCRAVLKTAWRGVLKTARRGARNHPCLLSIIGPVCGAEMREFLHRSRKFFLHQIVLASVVRLQWRACADRAVGAPRARCPRSSCASPSRTSPRCRPRIRCTGPRGRSPRRRRRPPRRTR